MNFLEKSNIPEHILKQVSQKDLVLIEQQLNTNV
jgi:hypothetical protein